jgi:hypothetical protein
VCQAPPEYATGFFDLKWPLEDMIQVHLKGMAKQMPLLYYAFGIALALNRTLILPEVRTDQVDGEHCVEDADALAIVR